MKIVFQDSKKIDLRLDEIRLTESGIERFLHPVFNDVAVVQPIRLNAERYLLPIVNNIHGDKRIIGYG